MSSRVGIDFVHTGRIRDLVGASSPAELRRIWTGRELEECDGRLDSLAGRWAAKEAVLKCLRSGIAEHPLTNIEVLKSPLDGSPHLRLHRSTLYFSLLKGLSRWTISISHDIGIAIAISVVEESIHTNPHHPKSQDASRRR